MRTWTASAWDFFCPDGFHIGLLLGAGVVVITFSPSSPFLPLLLLFLPSSLSSFFLIIIFQMLLLENAFVKEILTRRLCVNRLKTGLLCWRWSGEHTTPPQPVLFPASEGFCTDLLSRAVQGACMCAGLSRGVYVRAKSPQLWPTLWLYGL